MAKSNFTSTINSERLQEFVKPTPGGFFVVVKIKPASSVERLSISENHELVLSVRARAHEGAANERVIEIMAMIFNTAKSRVKIVHGELARIKRIFIRSDEI